MVMRELFNPKNEKGHGAQKDELLVIAALSGNQQALEELIGRHQGWIYNMAVRMLWNPQDAQDATQEILLKIVTHLSSSLQPLPVTIIANYLRYFFGYHTTNLASNLMEQFPNNNIYVIQALASRQVLTDYFGLYFNNFFSVFPIENPRIENTLLIVKES